MLLTLVLSPQMCQNVVGALIPPAVPILLSNEESTWTAHQEQHCAR